MRQRKKGLALWLAAILLLLAGALLTGSPGGDGQAGMFGIRMLHPA